MLTDTAPSIFLSQRDLWLQLDSIGQGALGSYCNEVALHS